MRKVTTRRTQSCKIMVSILVALKKQGQRYDQINILQLYKHEATIHPQKACWWMTDAHNKREINGEFWHVEIID